MITELIQVGDGEISYSEAEPVSYLYVDQSNIFDLTGIEAFINLTFLNCGSNQLTSLDMSNNAALIAEAVTGKIDVREFEVPEIEMPLAMVAEDAATYKTEEKHNKK